MNEINWSFISRARDFYVGAGFEYIEVPWIVSRASIETTLPPGRRGFTTEIGGLVGSAEQSFIELMRSKRIEQRKLYVAITPCFRDDDVDELHQSYFVKVELFCQRSSADGNNAVSFVETAFQCFKMLGADNLHAVWVDPASWDITLNDVEIGSYGVRELHGFHWTYGTGLAEPRFSYALRQNERSL